MRDFVIMLAECSAGMSVLALAYMLAAPLLAKRYSEKWRYYAWLFIVVGLIVPFRPHFGDAVIRLDIPEKSATTAVVSAERNHPASANPALPPAAGELIDPPQMWQMPPVWENPGNFGGAAISPPADTDTGISVWEVAAFLWLSGAIAGFCFQAARYFRFAGAAKRWSEDIDDENILELFRALKAEMDIPESRLIGLRLCTSIGSPMLVGFAKPCILLPKTAYGKQELGFILKHELVHYRRKDLWYKLAVMVATCLHWFNPVVYLVAGAIDTACERSCDFETLRGTDTKTRWEYGKMIIEAVRHKSKTGTLLSTQLNDRQKPMKRRLSAIMDTVQKRRGYIIGVVVVLAVLLSGYFIMIKPRIPVADALQETAKTQTDGEGEATQINYLEKLPKTDKLVLYRTEVNSWLLDPAMKIFEDMYPDVEVEVRDFENDWEGYDALLSAELPAGKGPDLLLMGAHQFPDIYKVMDTGVFCDLNDFIGSDPDFGLDDYNKVVMDSGIYRGKRYLTPISYLTKMLLTTEEALAAAGMSIEGIKTFDGYASEVKRYLEEHDSTKAVYYHGVNNGWTMFFPWSGLRVVDYENKKANVGGDDFKKVIDAYKDIFTQDTTGSYYSSGNYLSDALRNGDMLLYQVHPTLPFTSYYAELSVESSPVYFPFPAVNGRTTALVWASAAILDSAKNKANAYAFLKILLSKKIQFEDYNSFLNPRYAMPVLNTVFDEMASAAAEFTKGWLSISVPASTVRDYIDMYANVDDCQLYGVEVMSEVWTYMMPYFKDEDTYENCLNRTRNFLELYIGE